LEEAKDPEVQGLDGLREKLREQVRASITQDKAAWETGYICKPSQFFSSQDSIFHEENREMAEYECWHIIRTQLTDGSWNIPWSWADYPDEWAVSRIWWKGTVAVGNLLFLKGMGKLSIG